MMWPQQVQTFLGNGGVPNFFVATRVDPVNLSTELAEEIWYWSGHESIDLQIDGATRTLKPTFGALSVDDPEYVVGTEIRTQRVRMFGLSSDARALLQTYNIRFKPVETWWLCFDQGYVFQGAQRLFKGHADSVSQKISPKGGPSILTVQIASAMRSGTRTVEVRKSDASYARRGGDTAMEYATLTDVEGHQWGAKG